MTVDNSIPESLASVPGEKLERLLRDYGIAAEFIEFTGKIARTPLANRLNILAAMGYAVEDEMDIDHFLDLKAMKRWQEWLEPVTLLHPDQPVFRFVNLEGQEKLTIHWRIEREDGECQEGDFQPGDFAVVEEYYHGEKHYLARQVPLPELPLGYHQITLENGEKWIQGLIIVAPPRCFEPPWLAGRERIWGVSIQLYSISSQRNWGIGDFSDLKVLISRLAALGADFILLNPLHALDLANPKNVSPYSPIDRRFLNPLYIDPTIEEDFMRSPAIMAKLDESGFASRCEALRALDEVDYKAVQLLKYQVFDQMFQYFKADHLIPGTSHGNSLLDYRTQHGRILEDFAQFQADVDLPGIKSGSDPDFHMYLQWLSDRQLEQCQEFCRERGMKVGLVRDMAVGGGVESCEVRTNAKLFCAEARIGAPPDNFNPEGQNWGLSPLRPDMLWQTYFSHFRALLRENMTSCGGLRIDHVMALMRLWWCPTDGTNAQGAYVHYPVEELFAILRLESHCARCVIIGEDLGVVPPEIRGYIDSSGLLSNILFYFEKYDGWHFKKPEDYPERAIAIVANHDVPPLKAWWNGNDLRLRRRIGLISDDPKLEAETAHRQGEKQQVLEWLSQAGLLPGSWLDRNVDRAFDKILCRAIFQCCGSSRSLLVSVQLDDLAGLDTPVNIPGTSSEYPNWRRKIRPEILDLMESSETAFLLESLLQTRPKADVVHEQELPS